MAGPNIFNPRFDPDEEPGGFFRRRAFIAQQAGAERLGATLLELPPGRTASPYHLHYANEEMLIVLAGRPSLRTPEGWRELVPGEVVAFLLGERGAHQVSNFSDEPARFIVFSEMVVPEVCMYPDSGKIGAWDLVDRPGAEMRSEVHRSAEAADYWEGESPPQAP